MTHPRRGILTCRRRRGQRKCRTWFQRLCFPAERRWRFPPARRDVLHSRLSPGAIKEDVQEYARDTGQGILRNLEHRARENPLQAAAVAAGVAYPLWRLLTRIPVPILLIGAGLALTRRPGQTSARTGPNDQGFMSQARERVGEATDAVKQKMGEVSESVQQTVQSARQTAEQVAGKITEATAQVSQGTEQVTASREKLSRTTEAARTMTSDAASTAAEMVSAGYRSGTEAAARAGEQVVQAGQRTQQAMVDTIERHPMLVGAIGLAIGAARSRHAPRAPSPVAENGLDSLVGRAISMRLCRCVRVPGRVPPASSSRACHQPAACRRRAATGCTRSSTIVTGCREVHQPSPCMALHGGCERRIRTSSTR